MLLGCSLGLTGVPLECQLGVTWVLLRCYLGVPWVSLGCHLNVTWVSLAFALALKQNTFADYHRPSIRPALPTTWPLATKRWWNDHDENVWRNPSIIWPHLWEWTIEVTTEPPYPRPEGWLKAKLWLHSLLLLLFRCASISWFHVVSEWAIHLFQIFRKFNYYR